MKTVSTAFQAHLEGELTTLCTIWRLQRRDGVVMGFTDHVENLTFEGLTYEAETGYTRTAIQNNAGLNVDNLDVDGILSSDAITETDIRAGVYDLAQIRVALVNYEDLTMGSMKLRKGWVGHITMKDGQFTAEMRGLASKLQTQLLRVYTPDCDADLGDLRCTVDLTAYTTTGTVDAISVSRRTFEATIDGTWADGDFNGGRIRFDTGDNATSAWMDIKTFTNAAGYTLFLPSNYAIQVGDTFTVVRGCDHTSATCLATFSNLVNFRGFPFIPGIDVMSQTPNAS